MIIKSFEISKKNFGASNLFLIYGQNEGLKKEVIKNIFDKFEGVLDNYEEGQILEHKANFFNNVLNQSLFDNKKKIIIHRCSEKIYDIILDLVDRNLTSVKIFLNCDLLDKKSKLRNFFEKHKEHIIIPVYKDNTLTLAEIARKFFAQKKISISQEALNIVVNRCNGERGHLELELDKISNFSLKNKNITVEEIYKLTNLSENINISELVDNSLAKNLKKTSEIISESNYSTDETILIVRTYLLKAKRLLNLVENLKNNENIETTINTSKPPIFWKDKPLVKKQMQEWSKKNVLDLISKISQIELKIKKNYPNSLILLYDFIFEVSSKTKNSF